MKTGYVVQVNTGRGWRKRRDIHVITDGRHYEKQDDGTEVEVIHEGSGRRRAERLASACEAAPRATSSSDGYQHRVIEVDL